MCQWSPFIGVYTVTVFRDQIDHPVVEQDRVELGDGGELRAVVGDAAVGDGAGGLEHGRAHPVPQPPVLSPEERREQEDVLHPGVVFEQFFKFGPIIKFGRKWIFCPKSQNSAEISPLWPIFAPMFQGKSGRNKPNGAGS